MKLRHHRTNQGMTLTEVVVVLCVIAFLLTLMFPANSYYRSYRQGGGQRISCINNLKQLGLAYKVWAGDNFDKFPMEISITSGGSKEWLNTPDAWKTYAVMSNELSTAKVIYCPEDSLHNGSATNFTTDLTNKLSYFIGLDATDANPRTILAGDDNFLLNRSPVPSGNLNVTTNTALDWDAARHMSETKVAWFIKVKRPCGNILLTDGSVQPSDRTSLNNYFSQTGLTTNRLFIP